MFNTKLFNNTNNDTNKYKKYKGLIVEDHITKDKLLNDKLSKKGYILIQANSEDNLLGVDFYIKSTIDTNNKVLPIDTCIDYYTKSKKFKLKIINTKKIKLVFKNNLYIKTTKLIYKERITMLNSKYIPLIEIGNKLLNNDLINNIILYIDTIYKYCQKNNLLINLSKKYIDYYDII